MSEPLLVVFGLPVTTYNLGLFASLAITSVLAAIGLKRKGFEPRALETFLIFVLPLGVLLGRGMYVLIRLSFFLSWENALALRFWQGGYSVWGLVLSFLLSGFCAGKRTGVRPAALLDALVPYALLALALVRFCEGFDGQGFGQEAPAFLRFFPFAVVNEYEEWRYAIFMLEGAAALLFIPALMRQDAGLGNKTRLALILFCAFQILFESLREDEVLSWGFVKASQLVSAITLYALLLLGLYGYKNNAWKAPRHLAQAVFFLLIFVVVGLEFALDKTNIDTNVIYLTMSAVSLCLCLLTARCALKRQDQPGPPLETALTD